MTPQNEQHFERSPLIRGFLKAHGISDSLLKVPGVYALFDGDRVIYVGESMNLYSRLAQHAERTLRLLDGQTTFLNAVSGPLYFHLAEALTNGTMKFIVVATGLEDKKERLRLELEFCLKNCERGLYNKTARKEAMWTILT